MILPRAGLSHTQSMQCVVNSGDREMQSTSVLQKLRLVLVFACLSLPRVSRAADPIVEENVMVPMRDGVKLATDIVRPSDKGKHPALLSRTPYKKSVKDVRWVAKLGYVYVVQDVRGRYGSEGEFSAFQSEADDGFDTIEWMARQPWCDGNVGMAGGSYLGLTQVAAATARPPHLRCIMPAVPPADFDNYSGFCGGALRFELIDGWLVGQAFSSQRVLRKEASGEELRRWWKDRDFNVWSRHLPLNDPGPLALGGPAYVASWQGTLQSWEKPAAWKRISAAERAEDIQVPVAIRGGFYDIFCQEDINLVLALRQHGGSELTRQNSHLLIGPWVHGLGAPAGEVDFPVARATDSHIDAVWYEHWLRNDKSDLGHWPAIRAFIMNQDRWLDTDTWPPMQSVPTRYYLGDKSLSTDAPPKDQPGQTYSYDPANPVITLGGNNLSIAHGIHDHRALAKRPDVLEFMTPPLANALTVVGPLRVHLFVSTSAPDTDFTAMLLDMRPDGYEANVQDGIIRLRYRNGRGKGELVSKGQIVEADIDLWSTAYSFKAGHRLALHVSSSNFPRFDRNLNTTDSPATWTTPVVAQNTVYHDADHASYVELPVMR
jgi:hypothetical protein